MSKGLVQRTQQSIAELQLGTLASSFGISEKQAQSGVNNALAAIVVQLAEKSATSTGAAELWQFVNDHAASATQPEMLADAERLEQYAQDGEQLAAALYGKQIDSSARDLANAIGVDERVARRLLGVVTPVAVSALDQEVRHQALDAAGLAQLLAEQQAGDCEDPPTRGLDRLAQADDATAAGDSATSDADSAIGKLLPLIGLLALALLAWMFIKGGVEQLPAPATDSVAAESVGEDASQPESQAAAEQPPSASAPGSSKRDEQPVK